MVGCESLSDGSTIWAAPGGMWAPVADRPLRTASCWAGSRATSNVRPDASYMYYWVPPDASYVSSRIQVATVPFPSLRSIIVVPAEGLIER